MWVLLGVGAYVLAVVFLLLLMRGVALADQAEAAARRRWLNR